MKILFELLLTLSKLFFYIFLAMFIGWNMKANSIEPADGKAENLANLIDFFESNVLLFTLLIALIEIANIFYIGFVKSKDEFKLKRRIDDLENKLLKYEERVSLSENEHVNK